MLTDTNIPGLDTALDAVVGGPTEAAAADDRVAWPPPAKPTASPYAAAAASRPQLVDVLVTDLIPDPENPREDVGDVSELANSMASAGLIQPVIARRDAASGRLIVVAGHRRLAAAQELGWTRIPCVIRRDMAPDKVLAAMLIENGQRAGLDPVEEARALNKLMVDHGFTKHGDIGNLIGRTQVHVSGRLALLALPIEEQEAIRAGQMNLGDGIRRGRLASGKVRAKGTTGHPHLGIEHDLAKLAKARCQRLAHKSKGRNSVGGVACGECWESVIRADERQHLHTVSAQQGTCAVCGTEGAA